MVSSKSAVNIRNPSRMATPRPFWAWAPSHNSVAQSPPQQAILRNMSQLAQNGMKSSCRKIQRTQKWSHPHQNRSALLRRLCSRTHGVSPDKQGTHHQSHAHHQPRSGMSTRHLTHGQPASHGLFPIALLLPGSPRLDPGTWEPGNASGQSARPWGAEQRRSCPGTPDRT